MNLQVYEPTSAIWAGSMGSTVFNSGSTVTVGVSCSKNSELIDKVLNAEPAGCLLGAILGE